MKMPKPNLPRRRREPPPHTPEPWRTHRLLPYAVLAGDDERAQVAHCEFVRETGPADARRLVACINACRGMKTDWLERAAENEQERPPLICWGLPPEAFCEPLRWAETLAQTLDAIEEMSDDLDDDNP